MGANGFKELSLSSPDIVLASHLNFYGNRLVTGSADHRIRVFDMNNSEDWVLVDAWRGHNGEVLDVCVQNHTITIWKKVLIRSIGQMESRGSGFNTSQYWRRFEA